MTPVWQNLMQQLLFFSGLFALTFAALQESHLTPHIRLAANVAVEQNVSAQPMTRP